MVRLTRSQKIIVAEDYDNQMATQLPLPASPPQTRAPLVEVANNYEEAMAVDEYEMEQRLKDLKAAYKTALGGKKNKKGKGRQKGRKEAHDLTAPQTMAEEDQRRAAATSAVKDGRTDPTSDEGSLSIHLEGMKTLDLTRADELLAPDEQLDADLSPAVRATRQQLASNPAGQFDYKDFIVPLPDLGFRSPHLDLASAVDSSSYGRSIKAWAADDYASLTVYRADKMYNTAYQKITGNPETAGDIDGDVELLIELVKPASFTVDEIDMAMQSNDGTVEVADAIEDSFVEQITARSPAKAVTRIEDTVEALDQLEDAIEALDEVALAPTLVSPEKKKKAPLAATHRGINSHAEELLLDRPAHWSLMAGREETTSIKVKANTMGRKAVNPTFRGPKSKTGEDWSPKNTRPNPSLSSISKACPTSETRGAKALPTQKPMKRPSSLLPPKQLVKSVKAATVPVFELPGDAVARKLKEKREARLAQRDSSEDSHAIISAVVSRASTIKSTKAPTKPAAFEFPGEALSRRKREAHEARLKAQEEEERKRREFKANVHRRSIAPEGAPRDTVASRARKIQIASAESEALENGKGSTVRNRSSVIGSSRPSILASSLANISAPRATGSSAPNTARKVTPASGPGMSGLSMQRSTLISATSLKNRAKEIYSRDTKAPEDMEKERREREAAAKKSREEAGERGRQASREWAERQRAKKAAAGNDKGLAPGFGPGGQLGLKP
ncbi:MAG: hypothetical protein M1818_005377 [Claussenomyces sp. TS43310]|nr:MAG: hypothetical protein M1818_005377 [Claussenomyces sp. TS43310]